MGKNSALLHIHDRSLNDTTGIATRTGEREGGTELGDTIAAGAWDIDEQLIAGEEREARLLFLKKFFALLKQTLTPDEFQFIKLRFTQQKRDNQIAAWLGFKSAPEAFREIRKKLRGKEKEIYKICKYSAWEGAEAFVKAITTTTQKLIKDEETVNKVSRHGARFVAIEAATEAINRAKKADKRQKIKRRFYMRGFFYGAKFKEETFFERKAEEQARFAILEIIGFIDALKDNIDINAKTYTVQELATSCIYWLGRVTEELEKINPSSFIPKADMNDAIFEKFAKILIAESMNEKENFSQRCKNRREQEAKERPPYIPPLVMSAGAIKIASAAEKE